MMSVCEKGLTERALYFLGEARRHVEKACDHCHSDMVLEALLWSHSIEGFIDRMQLNFEEERRPSLREIEIIDLHLVELEKCLRPDRADNWSNDIRGARLFLDRFDVLAVRMRHGGGKRQSPNTSTLAAIYAAHGVDLAARRTELEATQRKHIDQATQHIRREQRVEQQRAAFIAKMSALLEVIEGMELWEAHEMLVVATGLLKPVMMTPPLGSSIFPLRCSYPHPERRSERIRLSRRPVASSVSENHPGAEADHPADTARSVPSSDQGNDQ